MNENGMLLSETKQGYHELHDWLEFLMKRCGIDVVSKDVNMRYKNSITVVFCILIPIIKWATETMRNAYQNNDY